MASDQIVLTDCKLATACNMSASALDEILEYSSNLPLLRKILFAAVHLPSEMPKYWEAVAEFSSGSKKITAAQARNFVENLQYLNQSAFVTDKQLLEELYFQKDTSLKFTGLILVSSRKLCIDCGAHLLLKADRSSTVTVYSNSMGTIAATHYRKVCSNFRSGCKLVQHYGFHCKGE